MNTTLTIPSSNLRRFWPPKSIFILKQNSKKRRRRSVSLLNRANLNFVKQLGENLVCPIRSFLTPFKWDKKGKKSITTRNSTNKAIDVEGMKEKEEESEQKKIKFLLNPISLVNLNQFRGKIRKQKVMKTTPILYAHTKSISNWKISSVKWLKNCKKETALQKNTKLYQQKLLPLNSK